MALGRKQREIISQVFHTEYFTPRHDEEKRDIFEHLGAYGSSATCMFLLNDEMIGPVSDLNLKCKDFTTDINNFSL